MSYERTAFSHLHIHDMSARASKPNVLCTPECPWCRDEVQVSGERTLRDHMGIHQAATRLCSGRCPSGTPGGSDLCSGSGT